MYQKIMIAVFFFACRESGTGQGRVLGRSWQVIRTCAILTKRSVACRTVLLKYWSIFNAKTIKKAVIPEELRHEAGLPFPAEKYVITWLGSLIASWLLSYGQEPNPIIFKSQKFIHISHLYSFPRFKTNACLLVGRVGLGKGEYLVLKYWSIFNAKTIKKAVIPEELRHEAGLPFPAEKYVITWLGSLIASWLLSYGQEPNPIIFKSQKFSPVQFSPVQDQCFHVSSRLYFFSLL